MIYCIISQIEVSKDKVLSVVCCVVNDRMIFLTGQSSSMNYFG